MEYYRYYFFVFVIFAYLIVSDKSVAKTVDYLTNLIRFEYEKRKWWVIHNPSTPWAKYFIWKRSMKLAKELKKELDKSLEK
jgi:hypothetical protein